MTPRDFWLAAADWGSYMHSYDPGACMYGFDEHGCVQSEQHRADCITWIDTECRNAAATSETQAERDANYEQLDAMLTYLQSAPIG